MRLVADLETDGLLDEVSKIHCIVAQDIDTSEIFKFTPKEIKEGVEFLSKADMLVFHNGIKYDIPVIKKLYPSFKIDKKKVRDTLVMTRLIYTNIKDIDAGLLKNGKIPGKLFGAHKLEAWGYRLGLQKGEYSDDYKSQAGESYVAGDEWKNFSQEMLDYCVTDVLVTGKLFKKLEDKKYSKEAINLEHDVAWLIAQQERNGFPFDVDKAVKLYADLSAKRTKFENELKEFFKGWWVSAGERESKVNRKLKNEFGYAEYLKGSKYTAIKFVEFNPSSRDHIPNRLQKLYGWRPELFTDTGKPKVDEDVIASLDYPPCKLINEYLLVSKRISQLAEGDQAWLKVVKQGKIHGSVNPNGAVTGRATHAYPNISQVPACKKPYGYECRELFTVPPGWVLVGADASGLELRCLAHYMSKYDGGKYGEVLLKGDIHSVNQQAAGLPTRDNAKTFIYGFLYGAGIEKIGKIVGAGAAEGKRLKDSFLKKTPALKQLIAAVKSSAEKGFLLGLDKRKIFVRSQHSALNTLLQGAGAVVCKKALVLLEERLQSLGFRHGWDGDYALVCWNHDEWQLAVRKGNEEVIAREARDCVREAGEYFNFRCPLDGESKIGKNWAETH